MRTPTGPMAAYSRLLSLDLGDIITLPDGRDLTVRSLERQLARPVGSVTGFLVAGEYGPDTTLVSIPASPDGPVYLFSPLEDVPASIKDVQLVDEGASNYWAPHLPNLSGALNHLKYRVFKVRGRTEPMILLWRRTERLVFILSGTTSIGELNFLQMGRDAHATEKAVNHHAAQVTTPDAVPAGTPEQAPGIIRRLARR